MGTWDQMTFPNIPPKSGAHSFSTAVFAKYFPFGSLTSDHQHPLPPKPPSWFQDARGRPGAGFGGHFLNTRALPACSWKDSDTFWPAGLSLLPGAYPRGDAMKQALAGHWQLCSSPWLPVCSVQPGLVVCLSEPRFPHL